GLGRVRARRSVARESRVPLDAQPHASLRRSARAVPDPYDDGRRVAAMAASGIKKLSELPKTIRNKNGGVDLIPFDIIFSDRATYERVKRARVLTRESVQRLYGLAPERISDFVEFDPGNAIKFTIYR